MSYNGFGFGKYANDELKKKILSYKKDNETDDMFYATISSILFRKFTGFIYLYESEAEEIIEGFERMKKSKPLIRECKKTGNFNINNIYPEGRRAGD